MKLKRRERPRENTVEANGTRPEQRSRDSHGTLSYLPDRGISVIILGRYSRRGLTPTLITPRVDGHV